MTATGNQKEVSVLRDDVLKLSLQIAEKYDEKLQKLKILANTASSSSSFLMSNDIEALLDNISEETDVVEKINVIDFELAELITEFCARFNKSLPDFDNILKTHKNEQFFKIIQLRKNIMIFFKELNVRKDEIILAIDKEMCKIKKDSDEINKIRNIYKKFPDILKL